MSVKSFALAVAMITGRAYGPAIWILPSPEPLMMRSAMSSPTLARSKCLLTACNFMPRLASNESWQSPAACVLPSSRSPDRSSSCASV
ncbi:MAG TPA: hypothetical protein VGO62_05525 [Myxococcota bacterium]